jgi:putative PEP-CTERM system TPR-repeat lipoprotein
MSRSTGRICRIRKSRFAVCWPILVLSACGLGLDNLDRLERGEQAFESGDYRAAIVDAKAILQDEPENVAARVLLGRSSLRIGDPRSAEKELRKALQLGADRGSVIVDLGQTLLMLREFERVEAEIFPYSGADEDTRLAILRIRADALLGQRRIAEARAIYEEILSARQDDLDTMLAVVSSYVAEGELLQARTTLNQILTIDTEYVSGWLASGSLAAMQQDLSQAESHFTKGAELAAQKGDLAGQIRGLTGLIEAHLAQGNAEDARQVAAELGRLAPEDPFNEYLAARVAYLDKDWTAAAEHLANILKRYPGFTSARVLMGGVQLELGNLAQAEVYLTPVVQNVPENLVARRLLAEVWLQADKEADAAQILQPVINSRSADAGTLLMAVRASLGAGNMSEAIQYLRIRAESDPDNLDLQMDLAAAEMSVGNVEAAQELLEGLSIVAADDAYRRDFLLVLASVREENIEEALTAARELEAQWPDNAQVHNLVGGLLDAFGDRIAARQSFETARSLDPTDIVSLISLGRLDITSKRWRYSRKTSASCYRWGEWPHSEGTVLRQLAGWRKPGKRTITMLSLEWCSGSFIF